MKAEEDGATREGGGASKYRPQPGDGWVQCDCGQRHWGLHGAAGLLLLAAGAKRNQLLVALQHRAAWTHQGGTWGLPGGARQPAETAAQAAVREAAEEAGLDPAHVQVLTETSLEHPQWSYTTVIARTHTKDRVPVYASDPEGTEVRWIPVNEVATLPLHPAFGQTWAQLLPQLTDIFQQD